MTSTLRWTMLSLTLALFGAAACSTTPGTDGGTTTTTTTGSAVTTSGGTTGSASTTTTGGSSTTGASTTSGGTTGSASTTTGGTSTGGSTGGTTGSFTTTLSDAGCWITPTRDPNAMDSQIANGCTSAQGVPIASVMLPCWDGGVTASSNLPTDFYNSGFLPGPNNGITCPTN
jgi:hypothetical protein